MSQSIRIRSATPEDANIIVENNLAMALETEHRSLDRPRLEAGAIAMLSDRSKGFYLIAEHDGVASGQLIITYEWSDWRNGTFWWIQSVYVLPACRRKGVYRALYQHVLNLAQETQGICGIRLYVDSDNRQA